MATTMVELKADSRTGVGKGEAKRLRRTGRIPAIAYGKGIPSTPLAVAPKDVLGILKSERGKNSVIQMAAGGKSLTVMIRDYSYHPLTRELEHVDFVEVKLDQEVDADVPLHTTGKAVGVTLGGILRQVYRTLPVRCTPDRIPVSLSVDVSHLKLGEHVATQDLKLEEGIKVRLPAEQTLVAVVAPEKERTEEAAPGAPGAAPAAGAAPGAGAGGATPAAKTPAAKEPAKKEEKKK
jgi:large subunit ribosomal protein L25